MIVSVSEEEIIKNIEAALPEAETVRYKALVDNLDKPDLD
jgi:hypothetical protein